MADPQQPVTQWDASGKPITSPAVVAKPVTEWDASGKPVQSPPPVSLDKDQAQTATDALVYSHMTGENPSFTYDNRDTLAADFSNRLGMFEHYMSKGWKGLTEDSIIAEFSRGKLPTPFEGHDEVSKFMEGIGQMVGDLPFYLLGSKLGQLAGGIAGTGAEPGAGTVIGMAAGSGAGAFALTAGLRQWLMDKYSGKKVSSFEEVMDIMKATGKGAITGAAFGAAGEAAPLADGVVGAVAGEKAYKAAAELATMTTVGSLVEGKVPTLQDFASNAALMAAMHIGMSGIDFAKEALPKLQDKTMDMYAKDGVHPAEVASQAAQKAVETQPTGNPAEVLNQIDAEIARLKPQDAPGEAERPKSEETPAAKPATPPAADTGETGIKNAVTDAEREERGLDPIETEARKSNPTLYDATKEAVDSGDIDPRSLATELAKGERAPTDEEETALLYDRKRLQNEHANVMNGIEDAREKGDTDREARETERLARVEQDIDTNDRAAKVSGSKSGSALQARQMMLKEDYSLANTLQRARVAGDGTVSPELRNRLEDLTRQLDEANKRVSDYEESKKQSDAQEVVEKIRRQSERAVRAGKRAETKEALKSERDVLYKQLNTELMQNLSANPVFNPKLYELFGKLAANHIKDGIVTIEGIVDAIHANIQEHGMSKREIRDYISQYGRETEPRTQSDIQKALNEAKKQGKLISQIEDAEAGEAPEKGKPIPKPSERVKELRKQLDQAMKDSGLIEEKEKADPAETRLKAYKTAVTKRIAELQKQLDTGDFTKPTKKTTILDEEAQKLKAQAEKVKGQVDDAIARQKEASKTIPEKLGTIFQKWRRGILISSASVGGKIVNSSMQRFGVTPIEELVGGVLSKLPGVSDIAEKAPRQGGGLNISAEAKALGRAFSSETAEQMWQVLKTGKSDLDLLYGKKHLGPTSLIDFIGHVHGALQTPAMEAEFGRSLEKRAQWALDNGLDIKDPRVQATLAGDAYVDANRAVFRQENFLNGGYKSFIRTLEARGLPGKSVSFMMNTVFPIVRLPLNIVGETITYSTGAVTGSIKVLNHVLREGGMDNLTMHEADNILRSLKKGSVGLAVMALGYYAGQSNGFIQSSGFYQRGDKEKPKFSVGGVELPSWMLDTPVGLTFQMGATMRRVNDAYTEKGKSGGFVAGATAGAMGTAKKIPFVEGDIQTARALESADSAGLFIDDLIQSLVVPPDVRKLAKAEDDDKQRKPTDLKESIEAGIPGLRENVPENKKKTKRFRLR